MTRGLAGTITCIALLISSCGGDDKADGSGGSTATGGTGGSAGTRPTGTGGTAGAAACFFSGAWTLTQVECDSTDITAQWTQVFTSTTAVASDRPGGGCIWTEVFVGPSCKMTVANETEATVPGDITVIENGVQACDPAGCIFTPQDAPCVVGNAKGGTHQESIQVNGDVATTSSDTGPCQQYGEKTHTTWSK